MYVYAVPYTDSPIWSTDIIFIVRSIFNLLWLGIHLNVPGQSSVQCSSFINNSVKPRCGVVSLNERVLKEILC